MIKFIIFVILFLSIQNRNYESIYTIKKNLFQKIYNISIEFGIPGTNDYFYKFESKYLTYLSRIASLNDDQKFIILKNPKIEIIFNLSLYESSNKKLFNYFQNDVMYWELIKVGIKFDTLKFFQEKLDFSFNVSYKIEDIDNSMEIYFDKLNKMNNFKYLLFDEKDEIYENKTLYEYLKIKVIENFMKGTRKLLLIYPECDLLDYLNKLINYFLDNLFKIDVTFAQYAYYRATITSFTYEEINKKDNIIILEKIKTHITLTFYNEYAESDDDYEDNYESFVLFFNHFSIDTNKTLNFGTLTKGDSLAFDILKQIITSIEL